MSGRDDMIADSTPVTVWLSPAQMMHFEVLLASLREQDPAMDDDRLTDEIFGRGLKTYGCSWRRAAEALLDAEAATSNAEVLMEQCVAQGEYIKELLARIAQLECPTVWEPLSTPHAVAHLQELMTGTGAGVRILDGEVLLEVSIGPSGEVLNVRTDELVELVDAMTVIQNIREATE